MRSAVVVAAVALSLMASAGDARAAITYGADVSYDLALDLTKGVLAGGAVLTPLGMAWGLVFPINKNLWTSSYVLFTAGTALILLGALYWLIDVRRLRGAWERWMVVYGMNAIAVYVASGMLTKTMGRIRVGGEDGTSLYGWIYTNLFQSWAGDYNGSLAFAVSYVLFWLGAMWILHRREIYIKV